LDLSFFEEEISLFAALLGFNRLDGILVLGNLEKRTLTPPFSLPTPLIFAGSFFPSVWAGGWWWRRYLKKKKRLLLYSAGSKACYLTLAAGH
jgi:hypothetical protein